MNGGRGSDSEDSEDDLPEIDLSSGNKDTCVLEVSFALFIDSRCQDRYIIVTNALITEGAF